MKLPDKRILHGYHEYERMGEFINDVYLLQFATLLSE